MSRTQDPAPLLVFYDGHCALCTGTARRLQRLDRGRGAIECIDLRTDPHAPDRAGVPLETLASSLHARRPSGELLSGLDAIRAATETVGRGWQARWTRWPLIRPLADAGYRLLARHRLRLFGTQSSTHACTHGACTVHKRPPDTASPDATQSDGNADA